MVEMQFGGMTLCDAYREVIDFYAITSSDYEEFVDRVDGDGRHWAGSLREFDPPHGFNDLVAANDSDNLRHFTAALWWGPLATVVLPFDYGEYKWEGGAEKKAECFGSMFGVIAWNWTFEWTLRRRSAWYKIPDYDDEAWASTRLLPGELWAGFFGH